MNCHRSIIQVFTVWLGPKSLTHNTQVHYLGGPVRGDEDVLWSIGDKGVVRIHRYVGQHVCQSGSRFLFMAVATDVVSDLSHLPQKERVEVLEIYNKEKHSEENS